MGYSTISNRPTEYSIQYFKPPTLVVGTDIAVEAKGADASKA